MKKSVIGILLVLLMLNFISAGICEPEVSLINQDPYPAIPGEYVKLVFQIDNIESPECETITFELLEKYPIIFDPNSSSVVTANAGFFEKNFESFLLAPYKVRIDDDALEGENPIETRTQYAYNQLSLSNEFDVYVEDSRGKFEIHIEEYSYATREMTIEILNIADIDVEALTLEIPKQDNIKISGTNRVVVGDLDSNEYTTADFKATPKDGEIQIKVLYTDQTGERREQLETINFDSYYFSAGETDKKQSIIGSYYFIILVFLAIGIWWFLRRRKKKKERAKRRSQSRF